MNYVFYDTESSGTSTRFDQVLQFAAVVTDEDFNEIDTLNVRCRLLPHVVPAVDALLVTGVNPYDLASQPLSAFEMACLVHEKMRTWGPAVYIGQNTLKFDEEILRETFYQNLLDPYVTTARGSIRADLLHILRAAHTADPDVIQITTTEKGNPSFKLDRIATLNGFPNHDAHDALGDVRATIYMARLIRERAPGTWGRMMSNADPKRAAELIERNRLVSLLTYFGKPKLVEATRLAAQPGNPKQVALFDVSVDPTPWLDLEAEDIARAMGWKGPKAAPVDTSAESEDEVLPPRGAQGPSPFHIVRTNAMPCVFVPGEPGAPVSDGDALERDVLIRRLDRIHGHPRFKDTVAAALELRSAFPKSPHIEEQIYDGFPSNEDKNRMRAFHATRSWAERLEIASGFQDIRLRKLGNRLIHANAPEVLPASLEAAATRAMVNDRILAQGKVPWTTLGAAKASLEGREDTAEIMEIRRWFAEFEEAVKARLEPVS